VHLGNQEWEEYKSSIFMELSRLQFISDVDKRLFDLSGLNAYLYHALKLGCTLSESEADKIVDYNMRFHEKEGGHPLQTAAVFVRSCKGFCTIIGLNQLFFYKVLNEALSRRGFYVNYGLFSSAETALLISNTKSFLEKCKKPTTDTFIWGILTEPKLKFIRDSRMFLEIGRNLNRSSYQMFMKLRHLFHPFDVGRYTVEMDQLILDEVKHRSVHCLNNKLGEELNRYNKSVAGRRQCMERRDFKTTLNFDKLLDLIAQTQNCNKKDINPDIVCLATLAKKTRIDVNRLRDFWWKEGRQIVLRRE